jgi:hypothetical protein
MRRSGRVDSLTGQHIKFVDSLAEALEVRQMSVEVERADAVKDA